MRTARRSVVALFSLLIVAGAAGSAAAEAFTLEFSPADGEVWEKTTVDRRTQDYADAAPRTEQITEITLDQSYVSQPDGSWHVLQDARSLGMRINGQALDNPMFPIIESQQIRVILNSGGQAIDAEGFRSLMSRYERELDPETYQNVRRQMKIANMVKGEVIKWNRPLAGLVGLEVEIGDRLGVTSKAEFQGTMFAVSGVIDVVEWTEVEGERGVRFAYRYDTTGEIRAGAEDVKHEIVRWEDEEPAPIGPGVRLLGRYEFVLVPSTGQLLSEHLQETVFAPVTQAPGTTATLETEIQSTWRRSRRGS